MKSFLITLTVLVILVQANKFEVPKELQKYNLDNEKLFELPKQLQPSTGSMFPSTKNFRPSSPSTKSKALQCNSFHWIFSLDESGSISADQWGRTQWILAFFKWWLAQWHPYCKQYLTAYTFDKRATLPPTKYYEHVIPSSFNPVKILRNGGGTDFGQALVRGLEFILLYKNSNTCFIMITDGQASYPEVQVQIFNIVQDYLSKKNYLTCVLCYHIKAKDSEKAPANFIKMCNALKGIKYDYNLKTFQEDISFSLKAESEKRLLEKKSKGSLQKKSVLSLKNLKLRKFPGLP